MSVTILEMPLKFKIKEQMSVSIVHLISLRFRYSPFGQGGLWNGLTPAEERSDETPQGACE